MRMLISSVLCGSFNGNRILIILQTYLSCCGKFFFFFFWNWNIHLFITEENHDTMHSKLVGWILHPKHMLRDIPSMLYKSMGYPVTPSPNTTEIYPMHLLWKNYSILWNNSNVLASCINYGAYHEFNRWKSLLLYERNEHKSKNIE